MSPLQGEKLVRRGLLHHHLPVIVEAAGAVDLIEKIPLFQVEAVKALLHHEIDLGGVEAEKMPLVKSFGRGPTFPGQR